MKGKSFLLFAMLWLPSITGVLYADGDVEDIPTSRPRIPNPNPLARLGDHVFHVPRSFCGYTVDLYSESMEDIYSTMIVGEVLQFPSCLSGTFLLTIHDGDKVIYSGYVEMDEGEE